MTDNLRIYQAKFWKPGTKTTKLLTVSFIIEF